MTENQINELVHSFYVSARRREYYLKEMRNSQYDKKKVEEFQKADYAFNEIEEKIKTGLRAFGVD